jgi:hypothetical protein
MILTRRKLLTGLIAAPIVVRAGLIMPVKAIEVPKATLVIYQTMYEGAVLRLLGRAEMLVEGDAVQWGPYEMRVVRS